MNKLSQRRWRLFPLVGLAVLLVLFTLPGCGEEEPPADSTLNLTGETPEATAEVAPPPAEEYARVTEGPLNLRREPDTEAAILRQLYTGLRVEIISRGRLEELGGVSDYWYEVRTAEGEEGYVFGAFLNLNAEPPGRVNSHEEIAELPQSSGVPAGLDAIALYAEAERLSSAGDTRRAVDYYLAALELTPENADGYFDLSELYFEVEDYPDAAAALEHFIRLRPESFWGHNNLGLAYIRYSNYPRAIAVLERAVQLSPEGRTGSGVTSALQLSYKNLIAAYMANGDPDGADRARSRRDEL
ncbi:tetratricopeptide repeat protein [bacterium]|nr:tetratricopeptide repeat protein [bacterium]